jgi:hypothetical protein
MNHIELTLRLHHPNANPNILNKWFCLFYNELLGEDDVYNIKYTYDKISTKSNACIIHINIDFNTPMIFEEFIEFINYFVEFENANVYTIYNTPVNIELLDDKVTYNKEPFYLQDLVMRNSKTKERLSELKHSWNQI